MGFKDHDPDDDPRCICCGRQQPGTRERYPICRSCEGVTSMGSLTQQARADGGYTHFRTGNERHRKRAGGRR